MTNIKEDTRSIKGTHNSTTRPRLCYVPGVGEGEVVHTTDEQLIVAIYRPATDGREWSRLVFIPLSKAKMLTYFSTINQLKTHWHQTGNPCRCGLNSCPAIGVPRVHPPYESHIIGRYLLGEGFMFCLPKLVAELRIRLQQQSTGKLALVDVMAALARE